MIINHNNTRLKLLGDPHLGREFVNNVPLHRRGEREKMVWSKFRKELLPEGCDFHINMGDLFDKWNVSYDTLIHTAGEYIATARSFPKTQFIILRGNHDANRDLSTLTAFDAFKSIIDHEQNIRVIDSFLNIWPYTFVGWQPVVTADQHLLTAVEHIGWMPTMVFGHWDTDLRTGPHNLVPTPLLKKLGVAEAYTGHVHLPTEFYRDGVKVTQVGSMQPYAHGEDATGEFYVTLSLDELDEKTPQELMNKCVRIHLKPGELFDREIDCLQLKVEREDDQATDEIEVTLDDFSLEKVFNETFAKYDIPDHIFSVVKAKWSATFT